MVIVNDDIYVVSTSNGSGKKPVLLTKLYNYLSGGGKTAYTTVETSSGGTKIAEHLNSITYHDHLFYIVTRNSGGNQIMAFGSDGVVKKKFKYSRSMIATINHYQGDRFLISVNGGTSVKYRMIRITDRIVDVGLDFRVRIPDEEYSQGNDSYYDPKDKRLYVTKFKDNLKENAIYVYDLCHLYNGWKYKPEKAFFISKKEKYEIEGIGLYKDRMYACVNAVVNGIQADEISRLEI